MYFFYFKVVPKPSEKPLCLKYLENLLKNLFKNQSGIIYCTTTNECDDITKELRLRGIEARAYYAPLDDKVKKKVYQGWFEEEIQVVVATIAFGMGIGKLCKTKFSNFTLKFVLV